MATLKQLIVAAAWLCICHCIAGPSLQCFTFTALDGSQIFEVTIDASATPYYLERSTDLVNWTNALYSAEPISGQLPWAFGENITNRAAYYRIRQ